MLLVNTGEVDLVEKSAINVSTNAPISAPIQQLYGFDKRGHLQWQHTSRDLPTSKSRQALPSDGVTIDVLQQYLPLRTQDATFPNLPSDRQTPNASNSVDLREYSQELAAYYREGNGTAIGTLFFNMFSMYYQMPSTANDQ